MKTSPLSRLLLAGSAWLAVCSVPLSAAEVVLHPVADAHVRSLGAQQFKNYGTGQQLEVCVTSVAPAHSREIYVKFDLSEITSVRHAKLRLYGSANVPQTVTTELASSPDVSWSETGLTWAGRPAPGPVVWDTITLQNHPAWHEWDVTQFLMGEKTVGREVVTFVLRNTVASTSDKIRFNSRENAVNPPELVIEEAFPWTYYEAEKGIWSAGAVLETGVLWGETAYEARGKQAVTLDTAGEYVEWTNVKAATHATIRYSIPDLASGTLGLYVNGVKAADLPLSSVMMRETKTGAAPPGGIVKLYDDVLAEVPGGIPAGATVRVQKDVADGVPVTVDFLEVETAPAPLEKPDETWVEVVPGTGNDRAAFTAAIAAANAGSKKVWIPAGSYIIQPPTGGDGGINVPSGLTIRGAGMWHTVITKNYAGNNRRVFSFTGPNVTASDFKVIGTLTTLANNGQNVVIRMDTHSGHVVERIWAEYVSLSLGFNVSNTIVRDNRVRNTFKDAIHFARDSVNNLIERNFIRNAGDDNVALVSYENLGMADNVIQYNIGECGWWGRGFTNIGGLGNILRYNIANNCVRAGVVAMVENFNNQQTQFNLEWTIERNVLVRCGSQINNPLTASMAIYAAQDFPMAGWMEDNLVLAPPFHAARITGHVGDAGTEDVVYFRYNMIEAPVAGAPYLRKVTNQLQPGNNAVHEPNIDL